MKYLITALLLISVCVAKDRSWQDGKALKLTPMNNGAAAVPIGTAVVAVPLGYLQYEFEVGDFQLFATTERNLNITLGRTMKLAIDNQHLFIIDDAGKERKLRIVAKRVKQKDEAK